MDQGHTQINGPHQGGWVELPSGESWFLHFQDRGPYGRIVHLQPMSWQNDWPVIGIDRDGDVKGEPAAIYRKPNVGRSYPIDAPQTTDEFNQRTLGLQWQWQANFDEQWLSLSDRHGWLRLNSIVAPVKATNLWAVPNLLLQKLPAAEFTVTTRVDARGLATNERTGLVMMGMNYSYLAIVKTAKGFRLVQVICRDAQNGSEETELAGIELNGASAFLRVTVADGPVCRFSYSTDGRKFSELGESFKAREGRWIGAKVGLFSLAQSSARRNGYAEFDWFRFE